MMDFESGTTMLIKKRPLPQPSMDAASNSSGGILFVKNDRAMMILYTDTLPSRMTTQGEPIRPSCFTTK